VPNQRVQPYTLDPKRVPFSQESEDVNANGLINSVDAAQVKSKVGTALPP
jgi:hypothetical protein